MKNRKTVVTAFVLIAVMLMAVGFAALTDNLSIVGEARSNTTEAAKEFENDIYFSAAAVVDASGNVLSEDQTADKASVGATENDHANYYVNSLSSEGDKAYFKFTIMNEGNTGYDAEISIDDNYPTNTSNYYKVTYSYGAMVGGTDMTVEAGDTLDVYVTVELVKYPDANLSAQFTLNLTATSK